MGQVLFWPTAGICQRLRGIVLSVFPLSLTCKSFTHHPHCYLNDTSKLFFKYRFYRKGKDIKKLGSISWVRCISFENVALFVPQSAKSLQNNKDSRILWVKDDLLLTTGFDMVSTATGSIVFVICRYLTKQGHVRMFGGLTAMSFWEPAQISLLGTQVAVC